MSYKRGVRVLPLSLPLLALALTLTACAERVPDTARGVAQYLKIEEEEAGPFRCESDRSCYGYTRLSPGVVGERLGHPLTPSGNDWVLDTGKLHVELWGDGPTRPITITTR